MTKIIALFFSLLLYQTAICQKAYPLHPSVGDTIVLQEKLDYSLFSDYDNNLFQYAIILFEEDGFVLEIEGIREDTSTGEGTSTTIRSKLSQEEIISEQKKIQKINAYYAYLVNREKFQKEEKKPKIVQPEPIKIDGPMTEQMKKEARMMIRLKEDQRRSNEFQLGLRPSNNVRFELSR